MNGMHYDEYSSSTEISSQENLSDNEKINILIDEDSSSIGISSHEKLSDDEKINILISHLTLLSKKYGLGEVNFWYEPFSDGYKNFSIKISPDKSADELIDLLYKIEWRILQKRITWKDFLLTHVFSMIMMLNNKIRFLFFLLFLSGF